MLVKRDKCSTTFREISFGDAKQAAKRNNEEANWKYHKKYSKTSIKKNLEMPKSYKEAQSSRMKKKKSS